MGFLDRLLPYALIYEAGHGLGRRSSRSSIHANRSSGCFAGKNKFTFLKDPVGAAGITYVDTIRRQRGKADDSALDRPPMTMLPAVVVLSLHQRKRQPRQYLPTFPSSLKTDGEGSLRSCIRQKNSPERARSETPETV